MTDTVEQVPLHRATAERYLSYALSVITSRALPDVRDGLKPVQRRILYTMYVDLGLVPSGRYRKCAAVVGDVMAKYHPHGDSSIYEALVRMAQPFSLRVPLVDGQGNFGSMDGDPAAAYRYTECRLAPLSEELLSEIRKQTVDFRPNYDGQRSEPIVLPAQFPNLLVNGSEGIAVGMATKIPPHNLGEIVDACVALVDDPSLTVRDLLAYVKGPDFPTGAHLLTDGEELAQVYETGQGTLKIRATWKMDPEGGRKKQLVVDSIPYGQNKAKLVEHIGEEVRSKRLPQVVDVRDESTDDVRIVLDLKPDAHPAQVMAYLYKRTDLQTNFPVNLTALVPTAGRSADGEVSEISTPARLNLKEILQHWLEFRLKTIRRRYQFDLNQLRERIHILEGFAKIFDALDEAIKLIRESDGRKDASDRLIARFDLSEIQADAILELRLYRLAKLEIRQILEELEEKRGEADRLEKILASEKRLWAEVKRELKEVRKHYADARRTLVQRPTEDVEFVEDAYLVAEETYLVVTRDGWVKRQSSYSGLAKIRVREGDEIGWLVQCSTVSSVTLFTNQGGAYTLRVDGFPATAGYGEPLSALFSFADREKVVGVVSHDPRHKPPGPLTRTAEDDPDPPYAVAVTLAGRGMRFPLEPHAEPSNKTGRRYARLDEGDQVFAVYVQATDAHRVCVASRQGRALVFPCAELPVLKAAGKGVAAIKLKEDDEVMAYELAADAESGPPVVTSFGRELLVREVTFGMGARGERGHVVLKRGSIDTWKRGPQLLRVPEPNAGAEPMES